MRCHPIDPRLRFLALALVAGALVAGCAMIADTSPK